MCKILGISKQTYYTQLQTNSTKGLAENIVVGLIKKEREIWKKGSGRNLHKRLEESFKQHQITIGRDKFFEVLRNNGLLIKHRNSKARTTQSYHFFNKYNNLVAKDAVCTRANEIWVSDITYIWLEQDRHFCYLSIITDMYSRKIVGYCVHENLSVAGCIGALKMAVKQRTNKDEKLIHHSDRGVQYCCDAYVKLLQKNSIEISMTQTGDPLENAIAERVNKTIKEEFAVDKQIHFKGVSMAQQEVKKYVDYYNEKRPHRSIEMLTPSVAHHQKGVLKRCWKTYYSKKQISINL
jgi:transposase InsO family protein